MELVIKVNAYLIADKEVLSAAGVFANWQRAVQYAQLLQAEGNYARVVVTDQGGEQYTLHKLGA